jgi:hypothetical protein
MFKNHFLKMFDWFDEPVVYYRRFAPMRSGVFDYMSRWMDSVDREMEKEFGDFYDSFYQKDEKNGIEEEGKKKDSLDEKQSIKDEKKEEKKESEKKEEETEPEYYSFSSSMYSGSDGVQHIYREEHDSKTGKHKVIETRRIGDKSMTLHRVTDKDGQTEEHETRKNIKDDEVEEFKKEWTKRNVPQVQNKQRDQKAIKE